ncbi:aspartate-alanine antiporter-like transporter, partial [Klebsiella pneumoniae]|uniref:aspartate-alanine antiporter-like transporter n=1 Tax=Klebsiella pneumoniae TaxID=573 RepID=UPI0040574A8B
GTVCVVGKMRDLILQLSKSSIYSTKPWIAYGIFITAIPLLTVGILARMLAKMNYLTLCGMLAGSMTDPPALAFANNLHATSGAAALSYATVYPLVMFLRIITPQLLAVLFWGLS